MQIYEGKERARISAWQEDAKFFMNEFVNEEIDAHHPGLSKDDVAPLGNWAATYHEKADIASQGALAAVSYVASKGIKRLREQASQGAQAATTLSETMKAERGAHGGRTPSSRRTARTTRSCATSARRASRRCRPSWSRAAS